MLTICTRESDIHLLMAIRGFRCHKLALDKDFSLSRSSNDKKTTTLELFRLGRKRDTIREFRANKRANPEEPPPAGVISEEANYASRTTGSDHNRSTYASLISRLKYPSACVDKETTSHPFHSWSRPPFYHADGGAIPTTVRSSSSSSQIIAPRIITRWDNAPAWWT